MIAGGQSKSITKIKNVFGYIKQTGMNYKTAYNHK